MISRMIRPRAVAVLSMLVISVFLTGFASGESDLAFKDDQDLVLSWKQVQSGEGIGICNVGERELIDLQVELIGFGFKDDSGTKGAGQVFDLTGDESKLASGMCMNLELKAKPEGAEDAHVPEPGAHAGWLVAWGPKAGMIRLGVTVSGPESDKVAPKKSAVGEEIAVTVPFTANVARFELPLVASAEKAKLTLPNVDQHIGLVYSEGRLGRIYVDGDPPEPKDGVLLLPVRVQGLEVAGKYKGTVNLSGNDDDAIKLTLTLEETAQPVVSEISVRGTRNPFSKAVRFQDGIAIRFHRTDGGALPALFEVREWVGVVSGEHQVLDVKRVTCSPPEPEGSNPQSVCLQILDLDRPGEFKGLVDVTDNDSKDDAVTLTVSVADGLGWAIGASAAGVLLAAVVLWLTQGLWPWLGLWNRFRQLEDRIKPDSQGCETSLEHPYRLTVDSEDISEALGRPNRLIWDTASDEYKALVGMLDDVEKAIDLFCKKSGAAYSELLRQFKDFEAFYEKGSLLKYFPPDDPPKPNIAKVVALQISPPDGKKAIATSKLQARLDLWEGLVKLMKQWVAMALAIYRYEKWTANLRDQNLAGKGLLGEDRAVIERVEQGLRESAFELYEAVSGEELAARHTKDDLDEFYDRLAKLSSKYDTAKVWVDPQTKDDVPPGWRESDTHFWGRIDALKSMSIPSLPDLLEKAPPRVLRRARIGLAVGLGVLALAVAVFTGLQANYFDKSFGTAVDYAKMVLLGGGAEALVAGLVTIVDRVFQRQ